ncbi:hypothetical protein [Parasedimentitalea psychrophila]|uniref:Transposase n=1 Tax=Parasedimentitalea psychrophila TaxID=2997337 RepID=A0A9Y2P5J9_9RHOB|nr:hypothetical protein [Parasedimentitalea psychrophila]WIY23670.1 hypothetical protein QPJ95_13535 [Parasedimentitalea psychrophila]
MRLGERWRFMAWCRAGRDVLAEHIRRFTRNVSYFEPWHYVPLLERKPGALRDGAPFVDWKLPEPMRRIKDHFMKGKGGDREFVDLVMMAQDHGINVVEAACDLAVAQNTLRLHEMAACAHNLLSARKPPSLTTAIKQLIDAETVERQVRSICQLTGDVSIAERPLSNADCKVPPSQRFCHLRLQCRRCHPGPD